MAEPTGLFNKLNLDSIYNVGLYISGIILIASFVVTPVSIDLFNLRKITFLILLLSVIGREADELLLQLHHQEEWYELAIFMHFLFIVIYLVVIIFLVKGL